MLIRFKFTLQGGEIRILETWHTCRERERPTTGAREERENMVNLKGMMMIECRSIHKNCSNFCY